MALREPISAENCTAQYQDHQLLAADPAAVIPWAAARHRLVSAHSYWFATVHADGRPHVRPVLAVWVDDALYTTTNPSARKARNLDENRNCAMTVSSGGMDLVMEGTAARVDDDAVLENVAKAYHSKYGWPAASRDGAFDAPYGAPTAGPPPYHVYAVAPTVVYGFGTDDEHAPRSTRWQF